MLFKETVLKEISTNRYSVKIAESENEVEKALKLRYDVFYEELGRKFEEQKQIDKDSFDDQCYHLLIKELPGEAVIGSYRMQTMAQAEKGSGFYSGTYYDLSVFDDEVLKNTVEVGRACIAPDHRNGRVLYLLWKGFAGYLQHFEKKYLFGSFGIPVPGKEEALNVYRYFKERGYLHDKYLVLTKPDYQIAGTAPQKNGQSLPNIPPLLQNYLDVGCKICSEPAYVKNLNLLHVMVFLDVQTISPKVRKMFFG